MLKRTPQSALLNPLDDFNVLDDAPPPTWTGDWVSRRLIEGFKTLRLIPLKGAPAQFNNSWPAYSYEWRTRQLDDAQARGDLTWFNQAYRHGG